MLEGRGGSREVAKQGWIQRVYHGMLKGKCVYHLPCYAAGQALIQRNYHGRLEDKGESRVSQGMLEGSGGSRAFTMVCWKAGVDPEGLPWCAGRQGGFRGFTMAFWKARRIQRVYHGVLKDRADSEGLPWHAGKQGGSRGFTMVWWRAGVIPEGFPWYTGGQGRISPI